MTKILESRLWVRYGLNKVLATEGQFASSSGNLAQFGSQFLLYDTLVIPTENFGILKILERWCGFSRLVELLEQGALEFVRLPLHLAYGGNGAGIITVSLSPNETVMTHWLHVAAWGSLEEAVAARIENEFSDQPSNRRDWFQTLVLKQSREFSPSADALREETYRDSTSDPDITRLVLSHEPPGTKTVRPNRLGGLQPNQVRVAGPRKAQADGIDLVLRVAEINYEIAIAASIEGCDLGTSPEAEHLLRAKLARLGATPSQLEQFVHISELASIPDIRPVLADGEISIGQVLDLRERDKAVEFREWLHAVDAKTPMELAQQFVAALDGAKTDSWKTRLLRPVATTAMGLINPLLGIAAQATDSTLVEDFLSGYNPKVFLDSIEKIRITNQKRAHKAERRASKKSKRQAQRAARRKNRK